MEMEDNTEVKKPKILIVEDDKFFRELISKKFEKEGLSVILAPSGKDAFVFLEEEVPDLILLDLILPGLSGYEILTLLRKDEKTKNVPVIILSNLGQREEVEKALSLGATDFMVKVNFTLEEVAAKVHKILGRNYL